MQKSILYSPHLYGIGASRAITQFASSTAVLDNNEHRTAFCALKHTRNSYKPAICMDGGLSFDASSEEVYAGEDSALAVGSGKDRGGSRRVWEKRVKRAEPQRERGCGDSSLDTTDSIRQQYRTAFWALNQTRSRYKPAVYMGSGLSFDASSGVHQGKDLVLER